MKKVILILCLFAVAANFGFSQNDTFQTIVKLKDGSVFEGKLIEYKDGEFIKIKSGNQLITINHESIKNIKHRNQNYKKVYSFKETGLYLHTSFGFLPGYASANNPVLGLNLDHSTGYQLARSMGVGLNLGIANYVPLSREVFYSLAAEIRGYFLQQNFSPYYLLKAGYGFTNKGNTFIEANGGLFLNPSIGFRLGGRKSANFTTEIGLSFQKGYFKQQSDWWDRSIIEKDILYKRFNIKFGMLF